MIPDPSRLEAALNRKATAVHQEAQRLSPRQLGPLRSDGIAQFGITAEEAMLRLATALGGPTVNHPRVLFIGGPLDGRIHPTPIPDTGRIDIHQNGTCFQYQTETLNIAGETTIVAVLDTPDTLPTQVQAALDLIAQHTQPFEDRPNGRPIEDDTSTNQ